MSFIQDIFDPATTAANEQRRAQNWKRYSLALSQNVAYKNRGTAFHRAKWGSVIDKSIADSNVYSQQLKNQWKAFKGYEEFGRAVAARGGLTGNESRTKRSGRDAAWLNLLAQRSALEASLDTESDAYQALKRNAVNQQNLQMQARDKLSVRPAQKGLAGMKSTNWGVAAFNMVKTGVSLGTGLQGLGAFDKQASDNNLFGWLRGGS